MADSRWDKIDINLLFQDPDGVADKIKHRERYARIIVAPEKLGCHGARVLLLRELSYDAYINLDDDMEVGPHTNYWPAVQKAMEPEIGFVLTNWAKTPELVAKKVPKMEHKFPKQIMCYNGGGMAYSEKIAKLMRELPPVKTAFDCAWAITSYVNGYTNCRYLGSLAVHRVCGIGGMSAFMKATPLHTMASEWLVFKPLTRQNGTCKDVSIPLDSDVKPEARAEHLRMRKIRFGK